jgi:hypothetical protein
MDRRLSRHSRKTDSHGTTGRVSSAAELGGGSDDKESDDHCKKHDNLESFLKPERGSSEKAAAPNKKKRVVKELVLI